MPARVSIGGARSIADARSRVRRNVSHGCAIVRDGFVA
ncbi:hypothetical protein BURMUCGD2M_4317 [Burkholderia multivorans CGD2M]|nr:hypothetical protein BURMUCGD2M_4317 [Burkholderia multivorans CGD2M]